MKLFLKIFTIGMVLSLSFSPSYAMSQLFFNPDALEEKMAPDFTLLTSKGQKRNMTEFRDGSNAIIFFWATWCPHCRRELRELNRQRHQFMKDRIKIILVDVGEDAATVGKYLKKNKIEFDVFLDEENSLTVPYNIIGIPTFIFVGKSGKVLGVEHVLPKDLNALFSTSL